MAADPNTPEILARVRRLETRMTKYMVAQGFDTGARQPVLTGDQIAAPGYHTTIADLITAVPEDRRDDPDGYDVYIGDRHIATLYAGDFDNDED